MSAVFRPQHAPGAVFAGQALSFNVAIFLSETATIVDLAGRSLSSSATAAELAIGLDTHSAGLGAAKATSDAVPASDFAGRTISAASVLSDTAAPVDLSSSVTAQLGNQVADSAPVAELVASGTTNLRTQPENLAATSTEGAQLGFQVASQEIGLLQDSLSGLVVSGVVTMDALTALVDRGTGVVGTIQGDVGELLVLTEQQFRTVVVERGVFDLMVIEDATTSAPLLTPTTVLDTLDLRDLVARLRYSRPPSAGSSQVRRFIVYYK